MRQPRLAEALGLIVPPRRPARCRAARSQHGGWLWVELAPASDYVAQVGRRRVPALVRHPRAGAAGGDAERPIFTPVVFPVSDDATAAAALGNFDKVFVEAIRFDDGFSKIVHARQPLSADMLDEDGDGAPIGRDEGVQLAWDDEDILEGQNRALGAPPDGEDPVLAPRGVFGYRVDVRPAGTTAWTSLSKVMAPLNRRGRSRRRRGRAVERGRPDRAQRPDLASGLVRELARRLAGHLDRRGAAADERAARQPADRAPG